MNYFIKTSIESPLDSVITIESHLFCLLINVEIHTYRDPTESNPSESKVVGSAVFYRLNCGAIEEYDCDLGIILDMEADTYHFIDVSKNWDNCILIMSKVEINEEHRGNKILDTLINEIVNLYCYNMIGPLDVWLECFPLQYENNRDAPKAKIRKATQSLGRYYESLGFVSHKKQSHLMVKRWYN